MKTFLLLLTLVTAASAHVMEVSRLVQIIQSIAPDAREADREVSFEYDGVPISLYYDTRRDRIRLVSIVGSRQELEDQLLTAMEANFDSTLDVRYAITSTTIWAAFLHPLSSLHEELFRNAIQQVALAKQNFGTTYSAGDVYSYAHGAEKSDADVREEGTEDETEDNEGDVYVQEEEGEADGSGEEDDYREEYSGMTEEKEGNSEESEEDDYEEEKEREIDTSNKD